MSSTMQSLVSMLSGRWFGRDRVPIGQQGNTDHTHDLFRAAAMRIHGSAEYEEEATTTAPYGYYLGRPIIGESTRLNGGIYVGAKSQEALVIDDRYGTLKRLFSRTCGRCIVIRERKENYEYEIFGLVLNATNRVLTYSTEGVEWLARHEDILPDQKISLDVYVENGIGVARHRVLLAAYLLEKLKDMGVINGHHAIERHKHAGRDNSFEEREMLVYTTPAGRIYEYDPVETPRLVRS